MINAKQTTVKNGRPIFLRLSKDDRKELEKRAKKQKIPTTTLVRELIFDFLENV